MLEEKPLILNIDTATDVCSVALTKGDEIVNYLESKEPNAHSRVLTTLLQYVFHSTGFEIKDIHSVAVSKGPGSYTGLRIGVSSAKGIAYGRNIPLLSVDTLKILAFAARRKYPNCVYLPMIDARRMEVYTAIYDDNLNEIKTIAADIVTEDIYKDIAAEKIILIGNGAKKCKEVLKDDRYVLDNSIYLSAKDMAMLSYEKFLNKEFEDVAYFEPYYLKEFIAVKSKVKGLCE